MNGASTDEKTTIQASSQTVSGRNTGEERRRRLRKRGQTTRSSDTDPATTEEKTEVDRHTLLFGIRMSIRYHAKRQGHFRIIGQSLNFLLLVLGSGAVAVAISEISEYVYLKIGIGIGIAAISSIKIAFDPSNKAAVHRQFLKDYSQIEEELALAADEKTARKCYRKRLQLESREPATLINLSFICYNEVAISMNPENVVHVRELGFCQRWLARWWDIQPYKTHLQS